MNEPIIRITNSPEAYDGFGTRTLARGDGPHPYRRVAIQPDALDWQTTRYGSGMYACVTAEDFRKRCGDVPMEPVPPPCPLCDQPQPCPDDCLLGHAVDCLDEWAEWTATPAPGCTNSHDHGTALTGLPDDEPG